jgi:hypothetical protein
MVGFDVFMSHNSEDKELVLAIATRLQAEGVTPWVDAWNLVPGAAWQQGLVDGLADTVCTALFVGRNGIGSWQNAETMLILNRAFTDPSYRLIPVLLPGAPADTDSVFPSFVTLFTWVDFRAGVDDPTALQRLIAGVRGQAPGPAPHRQAIQPETARPKTAQPGDLAQCLTALGVPDADLVAATEWLAGRAADEYDDADMPGASWPADVRQTVSAFERDLELFIWPERLLASSFYLSTSKLTRAFRAYRRELGDEQEPADRFRLLHRYLSERGRLAFGPSLLLLDQPFPSGDDKWLYFSGQFTIAVTDSLLEAVPEARQIIASSDRQNIYNLVGRIFGPDDPFFLPIIQFEGSVGPHDLTIVMSRKYVGVESFSASALGSALLGAPVAMSGFATLAGRELQPVICRIADGRW